MTTLTIDSTFCGPTDSGNGGYTSGRLAAFVDGDAVVTLRSPPPLDTPMAVTPHGDAVRLTHGDRLVAEASTTQITLRPPRAPSLDEARVGEQAFLGHAHHPFPECFVCGTARGASDGLRIFTGPIGRDGLVAATWTPHAALGDDAGVVRPEFIWSAIDCAGSWAPEPRPEGAVVLGRFAVSQRASLRVGGTAIVAGWPLSRDGRKYNVGSALFDVDGDLIAIGEATWIELQP